MTTLTGDHGQNTNNNDAIKLNKYYSAMKVIPLNQARTHRGSLCQTLNRQHSLLPYRP